LITLERVRVILYRSDEPHDDPRSRHLAEGLSREPPTHE
jgi:hypothetical protein